MSDIELVIKMPENTYRRIQALVRADYFENDICGNSMRRIAKGIPLPKGHGRLIDSKKYEQDIRKHYFDNESVIRCTEIALSNAPTIIEADKAESEVRNER